MTHARTGAHILPGRRTQLAAGVVSTTLDEGEIVIFTFSDAAVGTVDAAVEALTDLMRRCDEAGRFIRVLIDASCPGVILTPAARELAAGLTRIRPRLRGRVALVAAEGSPGAHQLDRLLRSTLYQYRERCLFFSREPALAWLREPPAREPFA